MSTQLPSPGELLPHRGIALALDELTALEPGVSASGLWTPDERYFEGHFPDDAFLPGHWMMESTALAGACAIIATNPGIRPLFRESHPLYTRQVKPGDTLELTAEFTDILRRGGLVLATGSGKATVNGKTVYRALVMKAAWESES